jgi:hypothetical protein
VIQDRDEGLPPDVRPPVSGREEER